MDNKKYTDSTSSDMMNNFLDEYKTNAIICSNITSKKYTDGVDQYNSLNNLVSDKKEEKPTYMN